MQTNDKNLIYTDLHANQMAREEKINAHSAAVILALLRKRYPFTRVLDVGCGLGTWLRVCASDFGCEVSGLEGSWLDRTRLQVDPSLVQTVDLEKGFTLGKKFDLAICLEVGEHLPAESAGTLIGSLTAHADVVLFSAAIPHQGGHNHVNERFPRYWADLFHQHGFIPLDFIRGMIWSDPEVLWWLRQNILVFACETRLPEWPPLMEARENPPPLEVVHPDVYLSRIQQLMVALKEHQTLMAYLGAGGQFRADRNASGQITLQKLG